MNKNLTIHITTFKHRFEKYLKPLIKQIKGYEPDIEVIVTINGEHKEEFDENYRKEMLLFLSDYKNVYPTYFPTQRGLAKLWNTGTIHASNDYVLTLNDDVSIIHPEFIKTVAAAAAQLQTSFEINGSFSHVVFKKEEIIYDLGGVNERLLGFGEEECIMWSYSDFYDKEFPNVFINGGIINHISYEHRPTNIREIPNNGGKYSLFNREQMYGELYKIDEVNGVKHGKIPVKLIKIHANHPHQYPHERFYHENKDKL